MGDREIILGLLPQDQGGEKPASLVPTKTTPHTDLWSAFLEMLVFHKGETATLDELEHFKSKAAFHELPTSLRERLGEPCGDLWTAEAGLTYGGVPIAETGSILLACGPRQGRLTSLVPPVHVAVLNPNDTVASLDDALASMSDRTSVLITGPSRTADVEGVIVMGVHGPKRLIVVPWTEEIPA